MCAQDTCGVGSRPSLTETGHILVQYTPGWLFQKLLQLADSLVSTSYLPAVTGACHCTRVFTWGFACRFWRANLDLQDYMESDLNPQPISLAPQSFYFLSFYLRRKSYISFYFCASVYAYLSTCTPCNGQLPACLQRPEENIGQLQVV